MTFSSGNMNSKYSHCIPPKIQSPSFFKMKGNSRLSINRIDQIFSLLVLNLYAIWPSVNTSVIFDTVGTHGCYQIISPTHSSELCSHHTLPSLKYVSHNLNCTGIEEFCIENMLNPSELKCVISPNLILWRSILEYQQSLL